MGCRGAGFRGEAARRNQALGRPISDRAQQRRESLGDTRKVRLDDARKIARQRFAQAELGTDPAAERKRAKAAALASKLTLGAVATRYVSEKELKVKDGKQRPVPTGKPSCTCSARIGDR